VSTLDPVQLAGLDFARGKRGVGWFMEQGLGKSLTALTEYSRYSELGEADRAIIICPNSFKRGWLDEIEKHGFEFDVHIFQSTKRRAAGLFINNRWRNRPPVFIVNYEAIRLHTVLVALTLWAQRGKTYLVIDESIQIKGYKTAQTKAVHRLAAVCAFKRILTGRPQTQGPHDLWGQLRAIGLFPETNFFAFRGAFCVMGGWNNKEVIRAKNPEALARAMAPSVFQAKKKDWLPALPRKDATIRDYKMSPEQLAQYASMEEEFFLMLSTGAITVDVAIAKYIKLAQIQTGLIYDEQGNIHELVKPEDNPRLRLLLQLLEEEIEGKCCVVYRHRAVFDVLRHNLVKSVDPQTGERELYDCAWIKGGMKPDEIEVQKTRFNADPHCQIILLQAEAAKYGHTLLGGPGLDDLCRSMIFFENSYSADTRDQIEDRIHRRGQTGESVLYIDLCGSDLDRRIIKALQHKEDLYRSVFRHLKVAEPA
jgi:SNF2 family DNA or RNA helicase